MSPITYITKTSITSDQDAVVESNSGLRLIGYSCREAAGSAASFNIVDGATGSGGTQVVAVELAANTSETKWFGSEGLKIDNGLSIDVNSGTLDVTLYFGYR